MQWWAIWRVRYDDWIRHVTCFWFLTWSQKGRNGFYKFKQDFSQNIIHSFSRKIGTYKNHIKIHQQNHCPPYWRVSYIHVYPSWFTRIVSSIFVCILGNDFINSVTASPKKQKHTHTPNALPPLILIILNAYNALNTIYTTYDI